MHKIKLSYIVSSDILEVLKYGIEGDFPEDTKSAIQTGLKLAYDIIIKNSTVIASNEQGEHNA